MNNITEPNVRIECPNCCSILFRRYFKVNSESKNVCPICSFTFSFAPKEKQERTFLNVKDSTLKEMSEKYRRIRSDVFNEATISPDSSKHNLNRTKLKNKILEISDNSNLQNYIGADTEVLKLIWNHLWTKNRYAGIKAKIASREIEDIKSVFDNYKIFASPLWDVECSGYKLISAGSETMNFLNRTGIFKGKQTIGNLPKLVKIVDVARKLIDFEQNRKDKPPINFITNGYELNDVWNIHEHLLKIGYTGDLTALHFMMDMGFQVMKPDIIISRLFLKLGWLKIIMPEIPNDIGLDDLQGGGKYGTKYIYTKPKMYKPIIELSRLISNNTFQGDLIKDIGWATSNPLREFDIFMVKSGQYPEPDWGIEKIILNYS